MKPEDELDQWFSRCAPKTSTSSSITQELVRKSKFPGLAPDLLNQTQGWGPAICDLTPAICVSMSHPRDADAVWVQKCNLRQPPAVFSNVQSHGKKKQTWLMSSPSQQGDLWPTSPPGCGCPSDSVLRSPAPLDIPVRNCLNETAGMLVDRISFP